MLDKLLQEYADKFGDNFPIFCVRNLEESEIADLIRKALDTNVPYVAEINKEADC